MTVRPMVVAATLALCAGTSGACSPRTLLLVDSCPDGGGLGCAGPGDASVPVETGDASSTTLGLGLVGLWHFDDNPGSPIAVDSSRNRNDGMLVGLDPLTAWVPAGRLGGALATNGVGYVLVPLSPSIAGIVTGVTISAWVYSDGTTFDYGTVLSRQIGETLQQYYHLSVRQPDRDPGLFIATAVDTLPAHPIGSGPIPQRVWTHLAGTYDGNTAALYVDGTLILSLSFVAGMFRSTLSDGSLDTTPVILGGNGNLQTVTELFPGRIDEIALYNRALDTSEILQLANAVRF